MKLLLVPLILVCLKSEARAFECTADEECKPLGQCPTELQYYRENKTDLLKPCGIRYRSTRHCCKINVQKISSNIGYEPVVASEAIDKSSCSSRPINITLSSITISGGNHKDHKNIGLINDIKNCGKSSSDKIKNGVEAKVHEFPWLALLNYRSTKNNETTFGCHGALITKRYVLTAAHCIKIEGHELISVRFGEHKISTELDCDDEKDITTCSKFKVEDVSIEKVILPMDYIDAVEGKDIALIKLCRDVELSKQRKHIKTICLPVDESQQIDNLQDDDKILTVAGWGHTEKSRTLSDVLLKANVPYLPNEQCSKKYKRVLYSSGNTVKEIVVRDIHMCAGGKGGNDSCSGDSGSALMGFADLNDKPRVFQHGIVSFGIDCQLHISHPGIYTRVSKFVGWILDNISES